MAAPKTRPGALSAQGFVDALTDPVRRGHCQALLHMMARATGAAPVMWGASMVGFGTYHYQYASGREGDWFVVGFAPRKTELVVYLMDGFASHGELLARLGPHKTGKSCLYLRHFEQVDRDVLGQLIEASVQRMGLLYPLPSGAISGGAPPPAAGRPGST